MDTEEKPKRSRGRPRKSPEVSTQVKKPRGRPRKKPVDKLSMKFLSQLQDIPLVKDVFFFSKMGTGTHGINLLFKVHIVFDTL